MCRLVAYLGEPVSPARLVYGGDHSLYEQSWAPAELLSGSVNADGYGVVWYTAGSPSRIAEARPIWYDDELERTLGTVKSTCVVAALRNATVGTSVDRSGQLPLVHERWSFVLNGFVPDFRSGHMRVLRAELPDELYACLRGSSDSETLFLLCMAAIRDGASMLEAMERTTRHVAARVRPAEAQLNMVMSDGLSLVAVRTGTAPATNSLYVAEHPSFAPQGIVLAAEPPDPTSSWTAVPSHGSIVIARDGSVRTAPLT